MLDRKKIAINGFGRIGRAAFKIALEKPQLQVVAINDLSEPKVLAHLLQYDTAYGRYQRIVEAREHALVIDGVEYPVFAEPDPKKLPWEKLGVDIVLECTGRFTEKDAAQEHIRAGAKKVILSAPAKGDDGSVPTFLIGVNEDLYKDESVVSNASCTTNSLAPVAKVIQEKFGIAKALMTTIHSYTADQNLQDGPQQEFH